MPQRTLTRPRKKKRFQSHTYVAGDSFQTYLDAAQFQRKLGVPACETRSICGTEKNCSILPVTAQKQCRTENVFISLKLFLPRIRPPLLRLSPKRN